MTIKEKINKWEPNYLHLIVLLVLLQLLIALFTDGFALTFDESLWQFIGRNWFRNGLVPYSGGVDNQSPLIFAIFGLSDKLFGVNYWFPRVLGTLCQSVGLYYVYKTATLLAGRRVGILAMSLYGLSLLWHVTGSKYVAYTETYEITFLIIAIYHYLIADSKKDFLITGCLAGIALGCRISAFFVLAVIFIWLLYKNRAYVLVFCAGILISLCCLALLGALAGIKIHDLYIYAFADNFNAGSPYDHTTTWKLNQFTEKFLLSPMVLFYPLIIGYCIIKKRVDVFVLWFVFAFAGICFIGEFTWVHLREVLPALSIMSAITIAHFIAIYKISLIWVMLVVWIVFFPLLSEPLRNLKKIIINKPDAGSEVCSPPYNWPDEGTRKRIGWWVRDHTANTDKVFVAGFGAQIQVYSERQSVYFNEMQTPVAKQKLFTDLQQHQPAMILVPLYPQYKQYIQPDERIFIDNLVAKDYALDRCMYNYNIYRIKK